MISFNYSFREYIMMTKLLSNRYFKMFSYVMLFAISFISINAYAEGELFVDISDKMISVFKSVRSIIFIVGGFGLVGLGFAAIFGKIKWTWLAALAAGLAIVALAGAVVDYVTQSGPDESPYIYQTDEIGTTWD